MIRLIQAFFLVIAFSAQSMTWAHPGHGESHASHYLTEPVHVIPLVVGLALLTAAMTFGWRLLSNGRLTALAGIRRGDHE